METKFTPGPWVLYQGIDGWSIESEAKFVREDGTPAEHTMVVFVENGAEFESARTEADARLIAAAPLLYEACKEIHDDLEVCPPELSFGVWQRLQAALAAAEKGD